MNQQKDDHTGEELSQKQVIGQTVEDDHEKVEPIAEKNRQHTEKQKADEAAAEVLPALKENKEATRKGMSEFPGQDRPAFRRIPEPIDSNDPETGADEPGPAWAAPEKRPPASQRPDRNSGAGKNGSDEAVYFA